MSVSSRRQARRRRFQASKTHQRINPEDTVRPRKSRRLTRLRRHKARNWMRAELHSYNGMLARRAQQAWSLAA